MKISSEKKMTDQLKNWKIDKSVIENVGLFVLTADKSV